MFYPINGKLFLVTLLSLGLISGCNSINNTNTSNETTEKTINCPAPPTDLPLIKIDSQEFGFHDAFNFQIKEIIPDPDTIAFKSFKHKFTLCRANNNWIVEEITQSDSQDNAALESYQTVQIEDKEYQYRVKLDGNSSGGAKQAIFELITPESTQPQQQILYNLEQAKKAGVIELGEPEISQAVVYGDRDSASFANRVFWTVFAYRGEGFGGVATIVSYDPQTNKINVIQPPEIAEQIINDLVITGNPDNPTFWIATQLTGEGNPYIPSMGLVAYRPQNSDYTEGKISSYGVRNSPIVGAIPTKLNAAEDILWVGTGNGICKVKWQTIDNGDSWECWRFAVMAKLSSEELPIYSSLLDNTADATINMTDANKNVEVLWWLPQQREPLMGRYEIKYAPGMIVELTDRGATKWDEYYYDNRQPPIWESPLYWVGSNWHWENSKFVRGFDEVELNLVGGGAIGINSGQPNNDYIFDTKALRGDLELLELTKKNTKVKYYSAWVEDNSLQPYLTIVPQSQSSQLQPNPLLEIKSGLD